MSIVKSARLIMQVQSSTQLPSSINIWQRQKELAEMPPANAATSAASPSANVTISQAARGLAATETSPNPWLTYRAMALREAEADPAYAKKTAEQFAYDDSFEKHGPLVDITHDPIRYSATGEVVTEESLAAFKAEAAKVTAGRIALFQAEKAKGTADAQILDKLFSFVDGQSNNYLRLLNWARPSLQNASA
ncbi:MAG: hypothetical protein HZC24_17235 [Rhodocyclales bacterium]|nr:hypothetical protein [Rhodocyclales bacterium]